jgi:hypothetical protein
MWFTLEEIEAPVSVDTPVAPDPTVCPTNALSIDESRTPSIDDKTCVGCGLCVVRCPVGAIRLDPHTAIAEVENGDQGAFVDTTYHAVTFARQRNEIASLLTLEPAPYSDARLVQIQMQRLDTLTIPGSRQRVYRLLARNTFLTLGLPARLNTPGDNNAFSELTIGSNTTLVLVEVEPNGDVLDAFRRVISGVAVVRSRYGVRETDVIPCVVMDKLPNVRVDYYQVVENAKDRICVSVRSLPTAALLLGIRSADDRLLKLIRGLAALAPSHPSLEAQASVLWGPVSGAGLNPAK